MQASFAVVALLPVVQEPYEVEVAALEEFALCLCTLDIGYNQTTKISISRDKLLNPSLRLEARTIFRFLPKQRNGERKPLL